MADVTIDLQQYKTSPEAKAFSGRPRGEYCRRLTALDAHDSSGDIVTVTVPEDTYAINMSFFLGLFGPSVRSYGREGFHSHYHFVAPDHIKRMIQQYVEEALSDTIALPEKKTA